jgi:hypothetical protein
MLLFLDFDGVLHKLTASGWVGEREENKLFRFVPRFESVVRDYPFAEIVISSSWREWKSMDALRETFSPDIAGRIIGMTPVLKIRDAGDVPGIRHREILAYLAGSGADWLALDDDASIFPPGCAELIVCEDGFRDAEERALRAALSRFEQTRGST